MKARYQYRIYPTDQQQKSLARLFGCVRVVWNDALGLCKQSEKLPKNGDLQKVCITQAKHLKERAWLSEVSNIPLQQSIADLGVAYKNYFDSLKGKRKGRKLGSPRFKKKDSRQSARFRKGGFSLKGDKIYLAKIGNLKTIWSRPLPAEPSSVTVIKDCDNRYFWVYRIPYANVCPKYFSILGRVGIAHRHLIAQTDKWRWALPTLLKHPLRIA